MGTRHLICVVQEGEFKVAQYGQWDGYPSGQGVEILRFLRGLNDRARGNFSDAISECVFDKGDKIADEMGAVKPWKVDFDSRGYKQIWQVMVPQFSRDAGAKVLDLIYGGVRVLQDQRDFGEDGLFCEWAYVIDLDKNVLEVHTGFHKQGTKARPGDRWTASKEQQANNQGYGAVQFATEFPLDNLPTDDAFEAILEDKGET